MYVPFTRRPHRTLMYSMENVNLIRNGYVLIAVRLVRSGQQCDTHAVYYSASMYSCFFRLLPWLPSEESVVLFLSVSLCLAVCSYTNTDPKLVSFGKSICRGKPGSV